MGSYLNLQSGSNLKLIRAPFSSKFQRGAWPGDVCESARGDACKLTPHPAAIRQSIDCPLHLIFC